MKSDILSINLCSAYWAPTECQALGMESGLSQGTEVPDVMGLTV